MTSAPGDPAVATLALHHVRLPVSDVMRSRDWYVDVLGFEPRLCLEEEDEVVGAVVAQRGGFALGLHHDAALARALRGFCSVALSVGTFDDLSRWCARLDLLGITHSEPLQGHLGWYVEVPDPDGLVIQLHTDTQPTADEA